MQDAMKTDGKRVLFPIVNNQQLLEVNRGIFDNVDPILSAICSRRLFRNWD